MLAGLAMDLIVTKVVDGTKGIHALMPKAIFKRRLLAPERRGARKSVVVPVLPPDRL
jgi:hypothetical protein